MNILAIINRRVRHIEKHLDIKIICNGEDVDTLFDRFSAFSYECADFVLVSQVASKKYYLHYDFNSGALTGLKSGTEIEIVDLFSNRHLRSILYTAHETLFLNSAEKVSELSVKIHKEYPIPNFCVEMGSEKQWFMIESVDIVNDSKVNMTGLLSIESTCVRQPINATCVFDIPKQRFTWEYMINGKKVKEYATEQYYSYYKMKMSHILYAYTELKIDHVNSCGTDFIEPSIVRDILKILKKHKISFLTKKKNAVLDIHIVNALIWNIQSVNNEKIVLLACDGNTLSKKITFNRIDRKVYASISGFGTRELGFANARDDNKELFDKAITKIEKRHK